MARFHSTPSSFGVSAITHVRLSLTPEKVLHGAEDRIWSFESSIEECKMKESGTEQITLAPIGYVAVHS
jgi:hypothetical protein